MAPLLRGRFASKGSGEDPEGDLSPPGMRRSSPCGNAGLVSTARARRQVRSKRAPCKRQNGPAFAGPYRAKGKWRESGGRSPSPGYAQKQPLRQCRSCHRRRARPPPGRKRPRPLQAAKRPRFCRTVSRQREVERVRRATSLPRVCAEAALRQCRSCHRRRARPPPGRKRPRPLQAEKNGPAFAGPFCVKGKRRGSGGRPLSPPGMRRSSPCGNAGHAIDGAPVRRQVGSARAPCKRQNGPAFAGPYRAKGKWRESGGRPLSPGYAQKQPLRPCRSCLRRRARPPPGPEQTRPLQATKRPRFCGAVLRQREAERIWRAISFARVLDASCSGVSPR